jgi:hypothetical protein
MHSVIASGTSSSRPGISFSKISQYLLPVSLYVKTCRSTKKLPVLAQTLMQNCCCVYIGLHYEDFPLPTGNYENWWFHQYQIWECQLKWSLRGVLCWSVTQKRSICLPTFTWILCIALLCRTHRESMYKSFRFSLYTVKPLFNESLVDWFFLN